MWLVFSIVLLSFSPHYFVDGKKIDCTTDILFVVDASTSVTIKEYDTMRNFIEKLTYAEIKRLGPGHSQVGVVMFSNEVKKNIPFDKHHIHKEFVDALQSTEYARGSTYLGNALEYVRTTALTRENGMRYDAVQVVMVLTDGHIQDVEKAKVETEALHKMNVTVVILGIGKDVSEEGLQDVAYRPENIIRLEDWKSLFDNIVQLRNCKTVELPPKKCDNTMKANIVFILDSSTSLGQQHFDQMKDFIINVTNSFLDIGKNGVEVALLQFSSYSPRRTHVAFGFEEHKTLESIQSAIRQLEWTKGGTKTGYAMMMAERKLMSVAREGVKTVVIVLTDGKATDNFQPAADLLHKKGYMVLAVGVGKDGTVDEAQLKNIASDPKPMHVYHAKEFSELHKYLATVTTSVCRANEEAPESKQQQAEKKLGIVA